MDQTPGPRSAQVGDLSPDGSRRWNGEYWVRLRPEPPVIVSVPAAAPGLWEAELDQRGYHAGKVILAAALGVILSIVPTLMPASDLNSSTFLELLIFNFLWRAGTYVLVVYVLSLGLQGIDVLVLRGVAAGALLGAASGLLSPVYDFSVSLWLLWILISTVVGAFAAIPALAGPAALLNLLWYRSIHSLRPQLPVFRPRRARA